MQMDVNNYGEARGLEQIQIRLAVIVEQMKIDNEMKILDRLLEKGAINKDYYVSRLWKLLDRT